ncbi:MAG: glycosyltransferase family 2 protein [Clostridia bacterium]|nr:glycosyltransferase family 2 protein [Bacilli bacterium]MBR3672816.1 glycosyltransferase family 2 protein [Clostridia bacterium]
MVDNIKLSIIIPYFETYELTERLLKGLSVQTTRDVEIIVIDDGCNEERLDIFNGYMGIKIIHHEHNLGTAKTRNEGIRKAKGQYISFIDCDDTVTMDYISVLLKAIDETPTEVINFNWLDLSENVVIRRPCNPAMWKAIYRNDICPLFREDLEWGEEDVDFQLEVGKMETTYLDRVLYIYNSNREGSLFWRKTHQ